MWKRRRQENGQAKAESINAKIQKLSVTLKNLNQQEFEINRVVHSKIHTPNKKSGGHSRAKTSLAIKTAEKSQIEDKTPEPWFTKNDLKPPGSASASRAANNLGTNRKTLSTP